MTLVLVDTGVWGAALRRRTDAPPPVVGLLHHLVTDVMVAIIGPIRQELLSGIRDEVTFARLRSRLAIFPDEPILPDDYVTAARFFNACRRHGVQGSHTDFLICAVASRNAWPILTMDQDFTHYARHVPVTLVPV